MAKRQVILVFMTHLLDLDAKEKEAVRGFSQ